MARITITPVQSAEYLGARAETRVVRTGGPLSERVVLTRWIDAATSDNGGHLAGTIVMRHCKGDGRVRTGRNAFQQFSEYALTNPAYATSDLTDQAVLTLAEAML